MICLKKTGAKLYNLKMPAYKPAKTYLHLIVVLAISSLLTAASAYFTYQNSIVSTGEGLRLQAMAVASGIEAALAKGRADRTELFEEIAARGAWEAVAFVSLYSADGTVIAHSNKNLVNTKSGDASIKQGIEKSSPSFGIMQLGTDEKVFVLDLPTAGGKELLRVALHTYPADRTMAQARNLVITIAGLIILLWVTGYFIVRYAKKAESLSAQIQENARLAMLGEMASVLAHEIRNPLGSIKGFAQYILEGSADRKALNENLGIIISESERLEALTEDLLLYARPSVVEYSEFSLSELISETLRSVYGRAGSRAADMISVSVPEGLHIYTDRYKLNRLLTNLVLNAVEATQDNGHVWITCSNGAESVTIVVRDDGPGMDKETKSRAFDPFFTTKAKGTGLGLAVVRKLAAELGGDISLDTEKGRGAMFTLKLPINKKVENEQA